MTLLDLIFGAKCYDCGERRRSDVCPQCFSKRLARLERTDQRVIAHPEQPDSMRGSAEARRWPEETRLRIVR